MRCVNVDAMLRKITARQLVELIVYARIEPYGERREDYRTAVLLHLLYNLKVKREHQKPLKYFLLKFEEKVPRTKKQSAALQEAYIRALVIAHNAGARET